MTFLAEGLVPPAGTGRQILGNINSGRGIGYIPIEFADYRACHAPGQILVCGKPSEEAIHAITRAVADMHKEGEACARLQGVENNYQHITDKCRPLSAEVSRRVVARLPETYEGGLWGCWGLRERNEDITYPDSWNSPYDFFVNHYLSAVTSEDVYIAVDSSSRRYVEPRGASDALVFCHHDRHVLESMLLSYYGGKKWDLQNFCKK